MKKLVTLVMIAAATTFAMTSCGGGEETANAFEDMLNEAAAEMEAADEEAAEEMETAVEEVVAAVEETMYSTATETTEEGATEEGSTVEV